MQFFFLSCRGFSATLQSISTGKERPSCATQREPPLRPLKSPAGGSFPPLGPSSKLSPRRRPDEFGLTPQISRSAARKMLSRGSRSGHFAPRLPGRLQRLRSGASASGLTAGNAAARLHFEFRRLLLPLAGFAAGGADESSSKAAEQQLGSAGIRAASLLCKRRLNSAARTSL